jgi:hypothetical protein
MECVNGRGFARVLCPTRAATEFSWITEVEVLPFRPFPLLFHPCSNPYVLSLIHLCDSTHFLINPGVAFPITRANTSETTLQLAKKNRSANQLLALFVHKGVFLCGAI